MVIFSKIHEVLPSGYGFVVGAGVAAVFVNFYLMSKVMKARKAYDVAYPDLYSATSKEFNCIQRAHQNYLEGQPQFYFLLCMGGLQYPRISAGCGLLYLTSRIVYAHGYYSGDTKKKDNGRYGMIGLLLLLGNTASLIYHLNRCHGFGVFSHGHCSSITAKV